MINYTFLLQSFIFFFLLNLFFFINIDKLIKIFSIYDQSNSQLKNSKKKISLIGGTIIFANIFCFFLLNKIFHLDSYIEQMSKIEFFTFFFILSLFYITGLYDDKYKISPFVRIFVLSFVTLIAILLNPQIRIILLRFSFTDHIFFLNNFSILFTIICFLLFTNALNMFDGINLQSISYCLIILSFIMFNSNFIFILLPIIISLMFLFFLNYKNKIFIGDSGVYLLSATISYILIYEYNSNNSNFFSDDIFILMMIPGLDFIRIFFDRIIRGKHPFLGDKNHIHHLLLKKIGFMKTYITIFFLYLSPLFFKIIGINNFITIIFFTILYFIIYFKYRMISKFSN
jgi:UDP-GlcNAc:undecaprenyl-phosphate GlcNAc-1-phosphate transferase